MTRLWMAARARARLVGAVALVIVLALVLARRPLAEWLWPDTRIEQLRSEAALALSQGVLTSPDGRGARELYEAALALDPDRVEAREGLAQVGRAAIAEARRAIADRRYADAHRWIAFARELAMPRATVDAVAAQLRHEEAAVASVERLLERAGAARAAGRLAGGDDAALARYQRVLALEPGNVRALEGREDTLADLVQQARGDLENGAIADAAAMLRTVQAADAGHADLPAAIEQLAGALDARRRRAAQQLRRNRPELALTIYREVLEAQPDDPVALRGVASVADAYAMRSERFASDFRFREASEALEAARKVAPTAVSIARAEAHVTRARQAQARAQGEPMTPARRRQLSTLLRQAEGAEARGNLLTPPGESAFDRLRMAREIAPEDARVRAASRRLAPAARRCFDSELRANRVIRARECLDAWQLLEGSGSGTADARRRLAQRWLAIGDERLGAGEINAAESALAAARELDPSAAGLDDFALRVRTATAASR